MCVAGKRRKPGWPPSSSTWNGRCCASNASCFRARGARGAPWKSPSATPSRARSPPTRSETGWCTRPGPLREGGACGHRGIFATWTTSPCSTTAPRCWRSGAGAWPAPERRVLRGGSWNNNPQNLRSENCNRNTTGNRNNNNGFRVAGTARPPESPRPRVQGARLGPSRAGHDERTAPRTKRGVQGGARPGPARPVGAAVLHPLLSELRGA